jgi:SAM-dependent methyltransferase
MTEGATLAGRDSKEYWTRHNVTLHHVFRTAEESLKYVQWRNLQYIYYNELMPVSGFDDKVVLDYGCGPGHDLVGFATQSRPRQLIGMDVSATSLAESELRMRLHEAQVELIQLSESEPQLPLPDMSVDIVHSSGVLHHTSDPERILKEFRRILKPAGYGQVTVYNYHSVWMHLYVAFQLMLIEGQHSGKSLRQAFTASTDGPDCPISECYTSEEFVGMCTRAGLEARLRGVAMSAWEMKLFPQRWDALLDKRLPSESRKFLYDLTLNERGIPCFHGNVAGISACFELRVT